MSVSSCRYYNRCHSGSTTMFITITPGVEFAPMSLRSSAATSPMGSLRHGVAYLWIWLIPGILWQPLICQVGGWNCVKQHD